MTLDKFNTQEIQDRLDRINRILDLDVSFAKDLRLHNELFVIKAIVDSWEFDVSFRIKEWEDNT